MSKLNMKSNVAWKANSARPRGLRQLRLISAVRAERGDRVRRQDRVAVGPAERAVRADLLRPRQRGELREVPEVGGCAGVLRRGRSLLLRQRS